MGVWFLHDDDDSQASSSPAKCKARHPNPATATSLRACCVLRAASTLVCKSLLVPTRVAPGQRYRASGVVYIWYLARTSAGVQRADMAVAETMLPHDGRVFAARASAEQCRGSSSCSGQRQPPSSSRRSAAHGRAVAVSTFHLAQGVGVGVGVGVHTRRRRTAMQTAVSRRSAARAQAWMLLGLSAGVCRCLASCHGGSLIPVPLLAPGDAC